jgi:hypothetical protein
VILPPGTGRGTGEAPVSRLTRASPHGVSDGARTRDTQDHNLVLYQLSYTHHVSRPAAGESGSAGEPEQRYPETQMPDAAGGRPGSPASSAAKTAAKASVTWAEAACASDVEGPGPSTNRVSR